MKISGWGKYPVIDANVMTARSVRELREGLAAFSPVIPRGLGRSYGDSSLSENMLSLLRLNRMLAFDEEAGVLTCEAGVSLGEIEEVFVPRGWFLPVVPGTKFVTVGGAIASDVHGKNHHKEGAFSDHVLSLELLLPDGSVQHCAPEENPELFRATCGGMGLTGVILSARFRLKRIETAFIRQQTVKAADLDEIMDLFDANRDVTYSVAWIDCLARGAGLGRSVLMLGEHAEPDELRGAGARDPLRLPARRKLGVPFSFPGFVLNSLTVKGFNAVYFRKQSRESSSLVDYDTFFHPLDFVHDWNRIYGARGFTQYQVVLPVASSREGLKEILTRIGRKRMGSFLSVLKLFGRGNNNLLSFPLEGYTLALDFPMSRSLPGFLDDLDRVVLECGGRLYLSKDVRMSGSMFRAGYEGAEAFRELRRSIDPEGRLSSLQSRRLEI
jgi:FAD/FMN-containing dehydrogenase